MASKGQCKILGIQVEDSEVLVPSEAERSHSEKAAYNRVPSVLSTGTETSLYPEDSAAASFGVGPISSNVPKHQEEACLPVFLATGIQTLALLWALIQDRIQSLPAVV